MQCCSRVVQLPIPLLIQWQGVGLGWPSCPFCTVETRSTLCISGTIGILAARLLYASWRVYRLTLACYQKGDMQHWQTHVSHGGRATYGNPHG